MKSGWVSIGAGFLNMLVMNFKSFFMGVLGYDDYGFFCFVGIGSVGLCVVDYHDVGFI